MYAKLPHWLWEGEGRSAQRVSHAVQNLGPDSGQELVFAFYFHQE